MKHLSILLLCLSLLTSYVNAKEKKPQQSDDTQSIEELIKEIKNNPLNRRLAINRLKIRLRNINTDIRKKIMLDLQSSLGGHTVQSTSTSSGQTYVQPETTQQQTPVTQSTPATSTPATSMPTTFTPPSQISVPTHTHVPTSPQISVPTRTFIPISQPNRKNTPFNKL